MQPGQSLADRVEPASSHAGDLARRVAYRRGELGLTQEQVAGRAEMDVAYLDYLEHGPAEGVTVGALMRLAAALETTPAALRGATIDRPRGVGRAGPYPRLEVLSREQCEAHLSDGGVGRFVFLAERGPVALPVNFRFVEGDVVFRTQVAGSLAGAANATVSLEVDHIDDAMSEGWSVLVTGRARRVHDPAELVQLAQFGIEPWPGGDRKALIRVETVEISGRSIHQQESHSFSAASARRIER